MSKPATILVIDDDLPLVQMLKSGLEADGYSIVTGFDGQMAVNLAKTRKPNLIIMDINMPMTNGLKALEFLRKTPQTSTIPIIFLSGEKSGSVYPVIESAQRVAFIKKPLDMEHLLSMVKQVLRQYPTVS
jgi:DNA-binding response OmpR family regulator